MQLLSALKKHKGPAIISGYPSDLYDSELRGWHRETTTTTDLLSQVKKEVLWMNFEPRIQTTLFSENTVRGGIDNGDDNSRAATERKGVRQR